MEFSVVIPARNAGQTIGECILATLSQSVPREHYEIIVIDDGSVDQTAAIARRCGVRVVLQPALGEAAARNAGARAARGDLVVFLNPDCLPKLDWLAQMVAPFADPSIDGVKGAYLTHEEGLLARLIQAEWEDVYRRLQQTESIGLIDGYSAAYRRSTFMAFSGLDPTFAQASDIELSCRMSRAGRRLVFAPKAGVYHAHAASLTDYLERMVRNGLWRALLFARHPAALQSSGEAMPELQAQIPLAGLATTALLLGLRWPKFLPLSGLFSIAFASTTVPSAVRARKNGDDAALAAPGFQLLRAIALGFGLTIGGLTLLTRRLSEVFQRLNQTRLS